MNNLLIPTVIEKTSNGERAYDLYSRLLEERIVFLTGGINDDVAHLYISQFLWLESKAPGEPIKFYINSPGGSVSAGLAIYDAANMISSPIQTFGIGTCASMGSVLLSAKYDKPDCKRFVMENARVMAHQIRGGASGQCSDILKSAEQADKVNRDLLGKIAKFTGQPLEKVVKDTARDHWMNAQEAVEQGYADKVISRIS